MKTFVLNLKTRTDRLRDFLAGFPSCLDRPEVWEAKPPEACTMPDWWRGTPAFWSHTDNFCDVLRFTQEQQEPTLFFEDDCVFPDDFQAHWEAFLHELPDDYDALNLCTYHVFSGISSPQQITPNVLRIACGFNTNAMVLTPAGAGKMLRHLEKPNWPCKHICEQQLGYLYREEGFIAYAPLQNFVGQRACYSELCKRDRGERWYNHFTYLGLDGERHPSEGRYEKD